MRSSAATEGGEERKKKENVGLQDNNLGELGWGGGEGVGLTKWRTEKGGGKVQVGR